MSETSQRRRVRVRATAAALTVAAALAAVLMLRGDTEQTAAPRATPPAAATPAPSGTLAPSASAQARRAAERAAPSSPQPTTPVSMGLATPPVTPPATTRPPIPAVGNPRCEDAPGDSLSWTQVLEWELQFDGATVVLHPGDRLHAVREDDESARWWLADPRVPIDDWQFDLLVSTFCVRSLWTVDTPIDLDTSDCRATSGIAFLSRLDTGTEVLILDVDGGAWMFAVAGADWRCPSWLEAEQLRRNGRWVADITPTYQAERLAGVQPAS